MHEKEQEWVSQIRGGNKRVFAEIYEAYIDEIYKYISRKIEDTVVREDITSETFYKAFEKIEDCCAKERVNIRARIYTIARNKVFDHMKKKQEIVIPQEIEIEAVQESPNDLADTNIRSNVILEFLKELGEDVHELFILRFRQQLSYAEIASVNGKSVANNKQIYSRTCKQIKTKFSQLQL